jgi:hypothetical protein
MIDEILVHTSAPATRQTDDLYRSVADAYLDFQRYTSNEEVLHRTSTYLNAPLTIQVDTVIAPSRGSREQAAAASPTLSNSKDSFGSFPSHLSSESKGNGDEHTDVLIGDSFNDDSIPRSSHLARLDRIHMHWRQTTPRSSLLNREQQARREPSSREDVETAFIEDTQLAAQALQSQLQETYSITSEDSSEEGFEEVDQIQEEQPSRESQQNIEFDTVELASSIPLTTIATPDDLVVNQLITSTRVETTDVSEFSVHTSRPDQPLVDGHSSVEATDFSRLPIDAFPPAAIISVERPGKLPSQVTKHLAAIKAQNPKRFRYKNKLYTPKYDDRGYWSVDCSDWPAKIQQEFWSSLCQGVLSGRLGWGLTLHRDASSAQALGLVRFYCWAEVAEHIWLLLWLCSKGKIVGSRSQWVDAEGAAVFEVA